MAARVLVGVTGGIAAYKAAELVRLLVTAGHDVHVQMTPAAREFITPLTLETLSQNPVATGIFALAGGASIQHTEAGRDAALAVVAPATADFLGRLAGGLADNVILATLMASRMPVLLCPSMNVEMWDNPLVQVNLARLEALERYRVVAPDAGWLACRVEGRGRLPEPARIMRHVARALAPQDLMGRRVVVTAGPTREWLDPVRFLSNASSGRMGYAVAEAAWERGADVVLVTGPTALEAPEGVRVRRVESTADLLDAVTDEAATADALIMAAAPADYRPASRSATKLKKSAPLSALPLERTPDILSQVTCPGVVVGFAAETHDVIENARTKATGKPVALLFANQVGGGRAFGTEDNEGVLLDGSGAVIGTLGPAPKRAIGHGILDRVVERLG